MLSTFNLRHYTLVEDEPQLFVEAPMRTDIKIGVASAKLVVVPPRTPGMVTHHGRAYHILYIGIWGFNGARELNTTWVYTTTRPDYSIEALLMNTE